MANVGIVVGIVLVVLGVGAYFGTGGQSVTALIPSFLGVPLAALGLMGRDERRLKMAMHVSVVLAFVGFLGEHPRDPRRGGAHGGAGGGPARSGRRADGHGNSLRAIPRARRQVVPRRTP